MVLQHALVNKATCSSVDKRYGSSASIILAGKQITQDIHTVIEKGTWRQNVGREQNPFLGARNNCIPCRSAVGVLVEGAS